MYYNKEAIERANSYNLVNLLRYSGYALVEERGGNFHLAEHDSLKISPNNGWKWFSQNKGGKNIDFFMEYENLSFTDAIDHIFKTMNDRSYMTDLVQDTHKENQSTEKEEPKKYVQPEANENNNRAYAYLTKTRGLDPDIVTALMDCGYIYESKENHNVVFLGTDYDGNVVSSFERGTVTDKKFARDTLGSNKDYRFRITSPESEKVNVFEAEIDMLSHISINGLKDENYIALGGVSERALNAFLEHKNIKTINLCLDNDEAGERAVEKIKAEYEEKYTVTREKSEKKDFNEDLLCEKRKHRMKM